MKLTVIFAEQGRLAVPFDQPNVTPMIEFSNAETSEADWAVDLQNDQQCQNASKDSKKNQMKSVID
jgi:hypothetical protein